jgi:hypothetical protein
LSSSDKAGGVDAEVLVRRKMEYWLQVNTPVNPPPPMPSIESRLPRIDVDLSGAHTKVAARLSDLRLFSSGAWSESCSIISLILSKLEHDAAERLEESLAAIPSPPSISPGLSKLWLSCVTTLYVEAFEAAVMGFYKIVWMWEKHGGALGASLEGTLAYYFRALQALGENSTLAPSIHILFTLARNWPERLCYWLDRTSSGGMDAILAMKRADLLLKETDPGSHETLLDFAADMGWRFLNEDDMPLWRAIARRGELLYRRLRGYSIPTPFLRLLSGILGVFEAKGGIRANLGELRVEIASTIFQEDDRDLLTKVLESLPDVCSGLDALTETEIAVDVISLKGRVSNPVRVSGEVIEFVSIAGGGLKVFNLKKFITCLDGNINEEQIHTAVSYARKLDIDDSKDLTDSFFKAFLLIGRVLAGRELDQGVRNSIKKVFGAVLSCSNPDRAVSVLQGILDNKDTEYDNAFITGSLLLRSLPDDPADIVLENTIMASKLLSLLDSSGLSSVTSGLPPFWFKRLSEQGTVALERVMDTLITISETRKRSRFLAQVVSPLLEELNPEDSAFVDCLEAAALEYNRVDSTAGLREAERSTLQRLFRAGGRTEALDNAIESLLRIPGLEGDRANELLEMQRRICGEFTRQEVWQENSNAAVSHFFDQGVNSILRAFVDYPEAIERISLAGIDAVLEALMLSSQENETQLTTWQIETGTLFFGRVFPLSVELFGKEPDRLLPFLKSIAAEAVHSAQGVPAGSEFLAEASQSLEHRVIEEYTIRLESWLSYKATPPLRFSDDWAREYYQKWFSIKTTEEGIIRDATKTIQFLTTRKELRKTFITLTGELFSGLSRASLYEEEMMIRKNWEAGLSSLSAAMGSVDLFDVFRTFEKGEQKLSAQQRETAEKFFREAGDPRGENPCTYWRRQVFSQFCNCLINMLLLEDNKPAELIPLLTGFQQVIEFLGAESPENILAALCMSLSGNAVKTTDDAHRNMERQLFRPLWRRRAMFRLELLVAGMSKQEELLDNLLDRLSMEGEITGQVNFLRWFGLLFLVIEEAVMKASTEKAAGHHIKEALQESWVFNPHLERQGPFINTVRETAEIAEEVFQHIRQRKGVITTAEAEEISIQMRRKYRDNADSVAILLRWTLDPSRESLLVLLEDNQPLLQAISIDTELLRMLDVLGNRPDFMELAQPYAGDPVRLKSKLREIAPGASFRLKR